MGHWAIDMKEAQYLTRADDNQVDIYLWYEFHTYDSYSVLVTILTCFENLSLLCYIIIKLNEQV